MNETVKRELDGASNLSSPMIYEVIRRDGEEELERPMKSLVWSAIAAGILISLSVLGEAIFRTYLPDAGWRPLLENLGYSIGFIAVIMGRMQLFTENTITTVLPVMAAPGLIGRLARLWAIVLGANVLGAFAAAGFMAHGGGIDPALSPAIRALSEHAMGFSPAESFLRGIPAGLLVAAIVWMMPQSRTGSLPIIIIFTWLIAAGDFTHVVAGSVEMAYLMVLGELGVMTALFAFFLPVLAGNIVGGTLIFSLLAWGQVRDEISDK